MRFRLPKRLGALSFGGQNRYRFRLAHNGWMRALTFGRTFAKVNHAQDAKGEDTVAIDVTVSLF